MTYTAGHLVGPMFWNVLAVIWILFGMFGDIIGALLGPLWFFDWRDERAGAERLERMKSDLRWK